MRGGLLLLLFLSLISPTPICHRSRCQQSNRTLDQLLVVQPLKVAEDKMLLLLLSRAHREDILLVLGALHTGDQPQEQVHHGGGADVGEQQAGEALLGLDVLDDLQARVLVRVPILYQPCKDNSEITV